MSRELVDLDRLPKEMRDRLSSALGPEEVPVVSIKGLGGAALLATDRRILLWTDNKFTFYPLKSISGIEWHIGGFINWLRIVGDGLEEERPTFRNLATRKYAIQIGQTPQEQRDALSQLVGTSGPPVVVASADASAPHPDVTPSPGRAPIDQPPTAGSDSVPEKDSVNYRGALPEYATGQEGGWKAQIAAGVEPGPTTSDPLATGPKDLAEHEKGRQARLTKRPGVRQALMAAVRAGNAKAAEDRRARLAKKKRDEFIRAAMHPNKRKKSAKGPFAVALIAGAAFLFLRANPGPATPATQATVPPTGPSWTEYQSRTATWSTAIGADAGALSSDGSAYDLTALYVDASLMQSDAQSYADWLEAHGSLPCYKNVWSLSVSAAAHYVEAGFFAARWSDAAPNGNPADLSAATSDMTQGASDLNQVTAEIASVNCP